jgi:spore coat polysaccharide biosynthesis protein SpsF
VEVLSFDALATVWREDQNPDWREHVTPFIYRHPERFRLLAVTHGADHGSQRWTVDTKEDLAFVREIYGYFKQDNFSWRQVLAVLAKHPQWQEINRHVMQKELA